MILFCSTLRERAPIPLNYRRNRYGNLSRKLAMLFHKGYQINDTGQAKYTTKLEVSVLGFKQVDSRRNLPANLQTIATINTQQHLANTSLSYVDRCTPLK